jgi:DNA-directed RNA polymerase I, II, and III subunit RPABC2
MSSYFDESETEENESIKSDDESDIGMGVNEEEDNDVDEEEVDEEEDAAAVEEESSAQILQNIARGPPNEDEEEDEDEENDNINYLQKFNNEVNRNYILETHPECAIHNQSEIQLLSTIVRNDKNIIIDDLHRTLPFLTKFEKARILGQRAKQINSGSKPFIPIESYSNIMDGYKIAELELKQKLIPFIIRRPLTNGSSEYWKVSDLENIVF